MAQDDGSKKKTGQQEPTGEGSNGKSQDSRGSRRSSRDDETATSSQSSQTRKAEDPFAVESPADFRPPSDGNPRLDGQLDDLEPVEPHLFDWTPERAGAIIKAGGYVLHTADRVAHVPGGEALWKATEEDARAAGEPLSRILNRYDAARRLAGVVDEAEFAAAMFVYAKRNLALRGQLVRRERDAVEEAHYGAGAFDEMAGSAERATYAVPPDQPPVDDLDIEFPAAPTGDDNPNQPDAFAFDPWARR